MNEILNFLNENMGTTVWMSGSICLLIVTGLAYSKKRKKAKQAELDAINESLNDPVKTFRTESEFDLKLRKRQLEKELGK